MALGTSIALTLLAACETLQMNDGKPALMTDSSPKAREALTLAASKAVGSKVTLAPDSFMLKSSVTIEPASVNKRNGRIIDGRTLEMPTHIDLIMADGKCYVVNRKTEERHLVEGVNCRLADIP